MDSVGLVKLVEDVVSAVAPGRLRMALVTGSAARGLADSTSDIDIYLYCDALEGSPPDVERYQMVRARPTFQISTPTGWFAKLEHEQRYVDVEAIDVSELGRAVEALSGPAPPAPWAVKVAAGLRDAIAIVGPDDLDVWNRRLTYRDETAAAEVTARSARLLSPVALFALTYERGDVVSFAWRVSRLVLDTLALLGAVNRRFIAVEDPKWIPWHIAQLDRRPARFDERTRTALSAPTAKAMTDLHAAIEDTLDLVDVHVAGADTRAARFALALTPRPPRRR